MAVVTGDLYLERLVRFVDRNVESLLEGTITLKLNPTGLYYVHSRLDSFREMERLLAGAPVDYLRAYVSDLGDHRALEHLRRILRLLTSLKVFSVLPPFDRDRTPLSLRVFGSLKVLELRGCDLSTTVPRGLLEICHTLEKLICHNSTDALRHVFASRIVDINDSPVWKRLSFVSCACNRLVLMDESLHLLPAVETLDLSRNAFAKVDNLRKCTKLQHLDLGFNHLRSVASLGEFLCPIVVLVLRNNALTTVRGIENLKLLEGIDISYNIISDFCELEVLSSLPSLKSLWLEGNPISCAQWYRAHVYSLFQQPNELELDGKKISTGEYWEVQAILTRKHKKPAGYGFYFPAKDNAGEERGDRGISIRKMKRHARVACIQSIDEDHRMLFSPETPGKDSTSSDGDYLRKDENGISDGEAEVSELINRVEAMKRERSVFWLRDFREWLDNTSEETLDGKNYTDSNSYDCGEVSTSQRKGHTVLDDRSTSSIKFSEDVDVANVLESEICVTNVLERPYGYKSECNEKTIWQSSDVFNKDCKLGTIGSRQYEPETRATSESNPSGFPTFDLGDHMKLENKLAPSIALGDLDSPSSSCVHGIPPRYKEDILQHHQVLEGEFLQISSESCSLPSSESGSSCRDDDSDS